jgi:hypothetical protein
LDRCLVTGFHSGVLRQRHLRKTNCSGEGIVGRTEDLEHGDHGESHIGRAAVGAIVAKAHVDVGKGSLVATEPTGLEGNGTSCGGPVCAVCRDIVTTAGIYPLHAIREGFVGDEVVSSPAGVRYHAVGRNDGREDDCEKC